MKKVIKCGQLFDSNTGKVPQDQAVVIDGNKIIEVVPAASVDCTGAEIIDLSGKFVMPGLIDAHVHINMNGEPSVSYAVKSDAATALDSMIYAQRDLLACSSPSWVHLRRYSVGESSYASLKAAANLLWLA